ncbi:MAG TPA: (5-formylfuran-3-yl)methyl phosphate synthase [Gemmatimonadaceae bacterium]|nr:(5-formylfuran-3-yl)methyl phosphate synthase [Gemmatimonadaceae bacterium]
MRLLVSVRDADEARSAIEGGAAIIDAKEPSRGALGAVELPMLRAIRDAVGDACPLSAALGDADDDASLANAAHDVAALGVAYVKIGFHGVHDPERAAELLRAAVHGADAARQRTHVIAVAYADAELVDALSPRALIEVASRAGARGVLLDTAMKTRGRLLERMTTSAIIEWVEAAHRASLLAALAGGLQRDDLGIVAAAGADVVGVRGAACVEGREGRVSVSRVRALAETVQRVRDRTSMRSTQKSGCPAPTGHAIPSAFTRR